MLVEPPATRADIQWRLFGFPVRVSPWFWVACVILGWNGAPTLDQLVVWTGCVFVAILVHELGHALVARKFGARGGRIVLYSFGGLAINGGGLKRWQRIVECLAGPGAGFLLYGALWLTTRLVLDPTVMSSLAQDALHYMEFVCLWWGLVNLLPVYPLDGGQVAHELFLWRRPHDGLGLALKFGIGAAGLVTIGFGYLWYAGVTSGLPAILFAVLGLNNYFMLRALRTGALGAEVGGYDAGRREAWEQDPDWWKA
ncbi:MAG: hypothetical protein KF878_10210 [Planctomycetes bacterium]|nr:hypothetical protein [Planctomycetota bacterium]